jgi:hypothetical protein
MADDERLTTDNFAAANASTGVNLAVIHERHPVRNETRTDFWNSNSR